MNIEGECFHLSKDEKLTWQDARRHCAKLSGGDLAAPREVAALRRFLQSITSASFHSQPYETRSFIYFYNYKLNVK